MKSFRSLSLHFLGVLALFIVMASSLNAKQESVSDFFDNPVSFDPNVPTPESVLGFPVGEWHARPEQIAEYMYALAATSNRVWVEEIGRTWEKRPLLLVAFSSSGQIANLNQLQAQRADLSTNPKNSTLVAWMGYSVHGNEASGSNAALLLAYFLAAAQSEEVDKLLSNAVILIDPMLNPDGLARFSTWVNANRNQQLTADPYDMEHQEPWPQGRTNHYWFDLNRDWLLAQHPESQARLAYFHRWKPHLVTDFHEMGSNGTYFFQPGVPSRQNPLTSQKNFELTSEFARYHAQTFDQQGQLFFTKEGFDDFYYGKGSTYPDVNGGIGILFEQASARGHLHASINGNVSFKGAIKNQLSASFSSLKALADKRESLLDYQQEFYLHSAKEAKKHAIKGYVYDARGDRSRLQKFNQILQLHQIKFYQLAKDLEIDNRQFSKNEAYIVPTSQTQFQLIRSLFETQTTFKDNTFYDVSTWTLPLAFNLTYSSLDSSDFSTRLLGKPEARQYKSEFNAWLKPESSNQGAPVALALDWGDSSTATVVGRLLQRGIQVRVAIKSSEFEYQNSKHSLAPGTVFIPTKNQKLSDKELSDLMVALIQDKPIEVIPIYSGLASNGIDLGSPNMVPLSMPKPIMLVGNDVFAYPAGEIWHLLDQTLEIPLVKLSMERLGKIELTDYTHLILAPGNYSWNVEVDEKIENWIKQGGHLIVNGNAGRWLAKQSWSSVTQVEQDEEAIDLAYAQREQHITENLIAGAIFKTQIDVTHPLTFGSKNSELPVFRQGTDIYQVNQQPFAVVSRYDANPLVSGYASKANQMRIAETPNILAIKIGRGSVVFFSDNLNFRGYWQGTSRLFANSLYFSAMFDSAN